MQAQQATREAVIATLRSLGPAQQQLAARLEACFAGSDQEKPSQSLHGREALQVTERLQRMLEEHGAQIKALQAVKQGTMEDLAAEYEQETLRLHELLAAAGIRPDSFPAASRDSLAAIAGLANELDLALVSENSLEAAWGQLVIDDMKASRLQLMLQQKQSELDRLLSTASASASRLNAAMEGARSKLHRTERKLEQQALQYWPDVPVKLQKYRDQTAQLQAELDANGLRPELKHSALVAQHAELERLQQELRSKQAQLDTFHGVPPSMDGAQRQLQLSKANLVELQQRLHSGLGLEG